MDQNGEKIGFFSIPKEHSLREKWLHAIPRKGWKASDNSCICSVHFTINDFKAGRTDGTQCRKRHRGILQRRLLKEDAVPSIWPHLPCYLSKSKSKPRGTSSLSESRIKKHQEREHQKMENLVNDYWDEDLVESLQEIKEKFHQDSDSDGTSLVQVSNKLIFMSISFDELIQPYIKYSLTICEDLSFSLHCNNLVVTHDEIALITKDKIASCSEINDILAFLKDTFEYKNNITSLIQNTTLCLETCIEMSEDCSKKRRYGFILEQLSFIKRDNGSSYSSSLLALAALWVHSSPSLYKQIIQDDILYLPSYKYIKRLSNVLSVDTGLSAATFSYLKARLAKLTDK